MDLATKILGVAIVVVGVIIVVIAILAGLSAVLGLIVMGIFGFLHGSITQAVPAYGFFVSWVVGLLVILLIIFLNKVR